MLQLNVSSATNSNAVYPDITASAGTTQILLDFTQSYDYSTKSNVIANLINVPGPTNPWLVFQTHPFLVFDHLLFHWFYVGCFLKFQAANLY